MDDRRYSGFETRLRDRGILTITFNKPERMNASTGPMKRDLVEVLTQAQMDDAVRVVVFTGSGNSFWAGDDMKPGSKARAEAVMDPIPHGHHNPYGTYNGLRVISQTVNTAVRALDKMTIAAINGFAIQTGFSLALACDFRIAAQSARMGSATLRFGLLPDEGGQYLLVQHLGVAGAMDFMMRQRIIDADRALELGLVHEVVADEDLAGATAALADELADGPQVAMRMLKRSIYLAGEQTWSQSLEDIAARTAVTDHHADAKEGGLSFIEKRKPTFNAWLDGDAGKRSTGS